MNVLRAVAAVLLFAWNGCWSWGPAGSRELSVSSSAAWSPKECLTVIAGAQNNNLLDNRSNVKVMALPYYPSVVRAIGRHSQQKFNWREETYQSYVNGLLRQGCGLHIDWDHPGERVYDARLRPLTTTDQIDSLLFLISLMNTGWPPVDLSRLGGQIFLVNREGKFILPKYVSGQRMNSLSNNVERIFVLFDLRAGEHHFLGKSDRYYLAIKWPGQSIRLEFLTRQIL